MACLHVTATDAATVECRVAKSAGRPAGMTGEQACGLVLARVEASLTAARSTAHIMIDLDLSRPGSAIARVRHSRAGGEHRYAAIAVDVMDRGLVRDDLVRLADAVSQSILTELQEG